MICCKQSVPMRYFIMSRWCLYICFLLSTPIWAFEKEVSVADRSLTLVGSGTLKYKGIIKVYDAALYMEKTGMAEHALEDVAKRIAVEYRVSTKQARFHKAGYDVLQKAYSKDDLAGIKERLDRLNGWYDDARKGERCAITYIPGRGTLLTVNGEDRGWIPGADFARMYFSIWLGDPCASKSLRKDLLSEK